MIFDQALWRFACSGTLLMLYGVTELLARRSRGGDELPGPPAPRWLNLGGTISLTAFYVLIGPTGSALAGGLGNAAGILLALVAMGACYSARRRPAPPRHAATAARMLFYTALPLAVGVPWGWVALTLPAYAMAAYRIAHEQRLAASRVRSS